MGEPQVEQKQKGSQSVTLNRIVVPAHVRIVPVNTIDRSATPDGAPANSAVPPSEIKTDVPEDASISKLFEELEFEGEKSPALKRMGVASVVLGGVIAVLLISYARTGDQEVATLTPITPAPTPANSAPLVVDDVQPTVAPAAPVLAPVSSPSIAATTGPDTLPATPAAIQPPSELPDQSLAPRTSLLPIARLSLVPTIDTTPGTGTSPAPITNSPGLAPSGDAFINTMTVGTVAALRDRSVGLPSAAESGVFGFVRTLASENRTNDEIGAMLQRAHDAGTLPIPDHFLSESGRVNMAAILSALTSQN